MKITLIKPNVGRLDKAIFIDTTPIEPLGLGVLAGLTPPDVDVRFIDDRFEPIPYDEPTDLVALTVQTFTARQAYEISGEFRKRGVPVVMGGFHPTLLPEEAGLHADSVVTGDAESIWGELIDDARHHALKPRYDAIGHGTPQAGCLPRRDIFKGKPYLPITPVQFGRGCKFACTYCAVSVFFDRTHCTRPVAEVVNEIKAQDRKTILFVDDNIVANKEASKELFRALIPLKIRWVSQASLTMVKDPELMELMVKSGCQGNLIGFESITPATLKEMKKTVNLKEFDCYQKEIQVLRDYGLQTFAFFMLGYDGDTPDSLYRTADFAIRSKFTFAGFNVPTPYARTPLYEQLQREDRLLYNGKWWLDADYRLGKAAYIPAQMSPGDLTRIAFEVRAKFNSFKSIVSRFLDPKTNMRNIYNAALYWKYNPIYRRELYKRQGLHLGGADSGSIDTPA